MAFLLVSGQQQSRCYVVGIGNERVASLVLLFHYKSIESHLKGVLICLIVEFRVQ